MLTNQNKATAKQKTALSKMLQPKKKKKATEKPGEALLRNGHTQN